MDLKEILKQKTQQNFKLNKQQNQKVPMLAQKPMKKITGRGRQEKTYVVSNFLVSTWCFHWMELSTTRIRKTDSRKDHIVFQMKILKYNCESCDSQFSIQYDPLICESDPVHCPFCSEYLLDNDMKIEDDE